MQERRIKAYFRYRDDVFIFAEGGDGNLGTLSWVANQSKPTYLIEGWVVSSDSIVFFDTELYKGPRWMTQSKIDSRTHIKPSSLGVPLSPQSSHPKWVHNWWPLGELRRVARRSTQHNQFIKTKNQSIQRLEKYNFDETVVEKCKKKIEFTKRPRLSSKKTQIKHHFLVVFL